jgi:hypothetical protein
MHSTFMDAVKDITEVMRFESWLRFYFVAEQEDGTLKIEVPEPAEKMIREKYDQYVDLLELVNHKPTDYETSVSTVCQYVVAKFDGKKYKVGTASEVFDSKDFQTEMYLFNVWQQAHEAQLDQTPMEFDKWEELYGQWKNSEQVQEYFQKVREKVGLMQNACSCSGGGDGETVQ